MERIVITAHRLLLIYDNVTGEPVYKVMFYPDRIVPLDRTCILVNQQSSPT